ncbi:ATP-binding protein [Lacrimispora sp.]|uniref:ATP-binding protein n=1 Tax=Lacrimispora sp. TaxID=2719234 RepID=UPI0028AB0815|nr:ATP-binding protein [Lacrimispora sp.]
MKKTFRQKLWLDRRSRKLQKLNTRKKKGISKNRIRVPLHAGETKDIYIAKAPSDFSFIQNTQETISYFMDILEQMERKRQKQMFFLDVAEVTSVTTDALVYIIALLYNLKRNLLMNYSFKGNLPKEKAAEKVFLESGFLNYVKTKRAVMPKVNDKVQIISGTITDTTVAGQICDFVNSRYDRDYKFTQPLYKTLIELMSNTVHHAYNKNTITVHSWYLYAIDMGSTIQFTFIDTGEGIPNTVKRKFLEKIPFFVKDSDLIYSAFMGESRTETGLYNRGHGLPALYEKVISGKLKNFYVLSGTGCCKSVMENDTIRLEKIDYEKEIFGSIFQFEIENDKEVIAC